MTSVVELMSNSIGHAEAQLLGQEALKELSGMYDLLDGRAPPAAQPAPAASKGTVAAPAPAASKGVVAAAAPAKPGASGGGELCGSLMAPVVVGKRGVGILLWGPVWCLLWHEAAPASTSGVALPWLDALGRWQRGPQVHRRSRTAQGAFRCT